MRIDVHLDADVLGNFQMRAGDLAGSVCISITYSGHQLFVFLQDLIPACWSGQGGAGVTDEVDQDAVQQIQ